MLQNTNAKVRAVPTHHGDTEGTPNIEHEKTITIVPLVLLRVLKTGRQELFEVKWCESDVVKLPTQEVLRRYQQKKMSRIECEARVSLWFVLITALTVNVNNHQQPNPWVPVERSSGEPPALPYVLIMLRCWDVVVSLLWCLFDASETFSLDSTSHTSVTSSHNAIIKNDTTVHVR